MVLQRVKTALVLAALLLLVLFVVPAMWASLLLAIFFGVGVWEWTRLAAVETLAGRVLFLAAAAAIAAAALGLVHKDMLQILQVAGVGIWLVGPGRSETATPDPEIKATLRSSGSNAVTDPPASDQRRGMFFVGMILFGIL